MKKSICSIITVIICAFTLSPCKALCDASEYKFTSSFIQNWYCRDWTKERWIAEFNAAKDVGFESLILQSTYDIVRGECSDEDNKKNPSAYPNTQSFCMFLSEKEATYHSGQNGGDALEIALEAAKSTGMKLWLGTVNDDMWWNYGWGIPDSYFEEWSTTNAQLSASLITEMWQEYGEDYGNQIAGWYYTNEIWNIDVACNGTDNGEYVRIIGDNINASVSAINQVCPDKPLLISPFYNTDISSPEQFGGFIGNIIDTAEIRTIDIYACQDGGGREYSADVIREWAIAQKKAIDGRMQFWINNECFDKEYNPKSIDKLREIYYATADIVENNIIFSWNHYYASDANLNNDFSKFSCDMIIGDANNDGVFDVSDVVILQKWLLSIPDTKNINYKNADLNNDGCLDVFDIRLMREGL